LELSFLVSYTDTPTYFSFTQQRPLGQRGAEYTPNHPIIYFRGVRKLEDGKYTGHLCKRKKNVHSIEQKGSKLPPCKSAENNNANVA